MGMYSTFVNQDIKIKTSIEAIKKELNDEDIDSYDLIGGDEIDFSAWCGHKLYGYFYSETVEILRILAKHVEGWAEFTYEEGFNFRIGFEEGEVYLQVADDIDWSTIEKSGI